MPGKIVSATNGNAGWQGEAISLAVDQSVTMQHTPDGSMIFAFQNNSIMNNAGQLTLTSGGGPSQAYDSPALLKQPNVLIRNWGGNNLNVTNTSNNPNTPIWIGAFGPGLGPTPASLPIGPATPITVGNALQGVTTPTNMQLVFQFSSGLALFGVIGGPPDQSGNNAYAIALNSNFGNTGPSTGKAAPPGYYATAAGNKYTFGFNWGTSVIYVAYFGSGQIVSLFQIGETPTVLLRSL